MRLGVDFGTTNSTVSLFDGEQLHPITIDPHNDNPHVMSSLIYIDRKGNSTVGAQAAAVYLKRETGRPVRWRRREAGEIDITVASFENDPIEFTQNVNVLVDVAARGRLVQSIKTGLFNNRYKGTSIFDKYYRLEALIAIILKRLKIAAEKSLGETCDAVMLGRPVRFADSDLFDSRAEATLLKAAHLAGFKDIALQLEPVGVTHLFQHSTDARHTALVFDFGGGTLDLTVAKIGGNIPPQIIATQGVLVGGDDLDRTIMAWLMPYFGGGSDGILSPEMTDKLRTWQTMPELSQPYFLERIRRMQRELADPAPLAALETLVTRNIGFKLFKEIENTKKALSDTDSAVLTFKYESIDLVQTLTRRRFERIIAPYIDRVEDGITTLLKKANMRANEIDVVLRTGGSSLVPAFSNLLASIFGEEKQRAIDPLVSVGGGFAVAAHDYRPPYIPEPETLIQDISTTSGAELAVSTIGVGKLCYEDRDFAVDRLPYIFDGMPTIQTTNEDKGNEDSHYLRFRLTQPAMVYVAHESTAKKLPDWLGAFKPANIQIDVYDEFALIARSMTVYGKHFPAGEVVLGGNMAQGYVGNIILHYLIVVQPC